MRFLTLEGTEPTTPCVATIGFFDGVHCGHRFLINQVVRCARERGLASLLVTFRRHPREVMQATYQPRLLSPYPEKCMLLAETGADRCATLDFTPEMATLSAHDFMRYILKERLAVKVLVIGYDHRFGHNRSEGFHEYVTYGRELGIEVIQAEAFSMNGVQISSSVIRAFLTEGEVTMAAACLQRPYRLAGQVVEGFHVGHELGFPTANLRPNDAQKLVPGNGVYAVKAHINGHTYGGMLNIGTRPTIGNGSERSIEVHLFDFSADLYGASVAVDFVERVRGEKKFRSKAELICRLKTDETTVRQMLSAY